jgi:hypothetical protein
VATHKDLMRELVKRILLSEITVLRINLFPQAIGFRFPCLEHLFAN